MIYTLEEAMKQAATHFASQGYDISGSFLTDEAVVYEDGQWKRNPDTGDGQEAGQTRLVVSGKSFDESWCNGHIGLFIGRIAEANDDSKKDDIMAAAVQYLVTAIRIELEMDSHG